MFLPNRGSGLLVVISCHVPGQGWSKPNQLDLLHWVLAVQRKPLAQKSALQLLHAAASSLQALHSVKYMMRHSTFAIRPALNVLLECSCKENSLDMVITSG
jgi:hypothetical protein